MRLVIYSLVTVFAGGVSDSPVVTLHHSHLQYVGIPFYCLLLDLYSLMSCETF